MSLSCAPGSYTLVVTCCLPNAPCALLVAAACCSALTPTVLERVHCHEAMLALLEEMDVCVAWLDERYVERRHLRLKLLFQASQRCGGWKEQKECILDTLTSMVVNAAQMHRAQVQANARIAAENTKSGVEEALSGIYDSDSGDDAQQDSAGDDAAQ